MPRRSFIESLGGLRRKSKPGTSLSAPPPPPLPLQPPNVRLGAARGVLPAPQPLRTSSGSLPAANGIAARGACPRPSNAAGGTGAGGAADAQLPPGPRSVLSYGAQPGALMMQRQALPAASPGVLQRPRLPAGGAVGSATAGAMQQRPQVRVREGLLWRMAHELIAESSRFRFNRILV